MDNFKWNIPLKFFLPLVGYWKPYNNTTDSSTTTPTGNNHNSLNQYCVSHIGHLWYILSHLIHNTPLEWLLSYFRDKVNRSLERLNHIVKLNWNLHLQTSWHPTPSLIYYSTPPLLYSSVHIKMRKQEQSSGLAGQNARPQSGHWKLRRHALHNGDGWVPLCAQIPGSQICFPVEVMRRVSIIILRRIRKQEGAQNHFQVTCCQLNKIWMDFLMFQSTSLQMTKKFIKPAMRVILPIRVNSYDRGVTAYTQRAF